MDAVIEIVQPVTAVVEIAQPVTTVVGIGAVVGPRGPAGPSGSAIAFEHTQASPAATWIITVPEAFGRRPAVAIYVSDELVDTDVVASSSQVSVIFPAPTAGTAVLT